MEGAGAVTDLSFDLRDGVLLLKLLAKLTDTQIPVEKGEFRSTSSFENKVKD